MLESSARAPSVLTPAPRMANLDPLSPLGLIGRQKKLEEELKKVRAALTVLQDLCPHGDYADSGHDSHHNYRTCTLCGREERY